MITSITAHKRYFSFVFFSFSVMLAGCASTDSLNGSSSVFEVGKASFYHQKYHGRTTASGERFDQSAMTASHRTLAFGTRVRVTHQQTGRSVIVTINDRGPFIRGRVIDLSTAAFQKIAELRSGVVPVRLEIVGE
jgi:rare lipoprotein A